MICHEEDKFAMIYQMDGISPQDIADSLSIAANKSKVF
jgi:hypothetical protein